MPNYFIKNEASVALNNGNFGNFTGAGMRYNLDGGTCEGMIAFKANDCSKGGFGEFKYTSTPKNNLAFESRTRVQIESGGSNVNTRFAGKYSKNIGKNFNIYEIAGMTTKMPLEKGGFESVTPLSLTGVGYSLGKASIYGEFEIAKNYNLDTNSFGKTTPSAYLGVRYNF